MKKLLFVLAPIFLLAQSAFAAIQQLQPVAVPAPALAPWGMVGSAVALGLSGLYYIIRRNK